MNNDLKNRGVYSGGIGYINCNHDLDFALAIRTMMVDDTHINVEAGVWSYMILFLKKNLLKHN